MTLTLKAQPGGLQALAERDLQTGDILKYRVWDYEVQGRKPYTAMALVPWVWDSDLGQFVYRLATLPITDCWIELEVARPCPTL